MTDRIKQDINALVEQPRQPRTLPPVEPVGGIPAGRGIARTVLVTAAAVEG